MGISRKVKKAVFLDRDGVINELIYNETGMEYEPPHRTEDIKIIKGVAEALGKLRDNGFELFIISNQPDYAKGKTSLDNLSLVRNKFMEILNKDREIVKEDFYCYHHPEGVTDGFSIDCDCRKPKTLSVDKAVNKYEIDRSSSWMIGDRETDIECGINSLLKTILIKNKYNLYHGKVKPDYTADDLFSAAKIILNKKL